MLEKLSIRKLLLVLQCLAYNKLLSLVVMFLALRMEIFRFLILLNTCMALSHWELSLETNLIDRQPVMWYTVNSELIFEGYF